MSRCDKGAAIGFNALARGKGNIAVDTTTTGSTVAVDNSQDNLNRARTVRELTNGLACATCADKRQGLSNAIGLGRKLATQSITEANEVSFGNTAKGKELNRLSRDPLVVGVVTIPSTLEASTMDPTNKLVPASLPNNITCVLKSERAVVVHKTGSTVAASVLS